MHGFDLWRCHELSWLDRKGKPWAALLDIIYPCSSSNIIESKSLKLYLNGLSNTSFPDAEELKKVITGDLEAVLDTPWINTRIIHPDTFFCTGNNSPEPGICIDNIETDISIDKVDPSILAAGKELTAEILTSNLLRTVCPITGQPDWAGVHIEYHGFRIDHTSLLRYLCSYRYHEGFSEDCCERIFKDLLMQCRPEKLIVACFYTRRGGIDINPVRSIHELSPEIFSGYRMFRQ